uniref:Eclosion hormone n=1 Tax=Palaemon carinicauda TaxID=392227 RepID=A0A3S6GYU4_PALCI|nr:eclosion hormone [Palaemon carinicauda]
MFVSRKAVSSSLLVLSILLALFLVRAHALSIDVTRKVGICIDNCGHCKEMYHDYFKGGLCAEFCQKLRGRLIIDCGDPHTLLPFFLERLE